MPTIPDDPALPGSRTERVGAPARARARHLMLAWWPFLALGLLLAVLGWRLAGDDGAPAERSPRVAVAERSFGAARLDVPVEWVTIDRSDDHVTWGDPQRLHTVTLAHVEASVLPLPGVVQAMAEESSDALPGAHLLEPPRQLELPEAAGPGDAAMLARFRVRGSDAEPLEVAQVWRREERAGVDVVATWTSGDGRWPVAPRDGIPRAEADG